MLTSRCSHNRSFDSHKAITVRTSGSPPWTRSFLVSVIHTGGIDNYQCLGYTQSEEERNDTV